MKKVLYGFLILIGLIIAAIIILPIVFKDDIKIAVDDAIAENLNAEVHYNQDKFDLSLLSHFPNITVSIGEFGITGIERFKGDTLIDVKELSVTVDIMSVIGGDEISVVGFLLDEPYINAIKLDSNTFNWDIVKATEEDSVEVPEDTSAAPGIDIQKWEIRNARVSYLDKTMPIDLKIKNFSHEGNGNFAEAIFDMETMTSMEGLSCEFDGITYLNEAKFEAKLDLNMNMTDSKYTFNENSLTLNDFTFGFDGFVAMPTDDIEMDIAFNTDETDFKSILSLVPGVFLEGFEDMKTEGAFSFDGLVKGTFGEEKIPGFKVNLLVNDAMFQYPDLPSAVKNINVDLNVDSKENDMENMSVRLKKFHLDMGSNPVDAKAIIDMQNSFEAYKVDADVNAKVNLGEMTKFYPLEGLTLKGLFALNAKVNGLFNDTQFPSTNAKMNLSDGFVKSADFPAPMDKMNFDIAIQNDNGELSHTVIDVNAFEMELDGEPASMTAHVEDLDSPNFDVNMKGAIDFEKLSKVLALEDMTMKGRMQMDLSTKGSMSDIDAENYAAVPTSGSMQFENFYYADADLPQGFKMSKADFSFSPKEISIDQFEGHLGKSDMNITGAMTNYINYIFGENQVIKGTMVFKSSTFDVNEWMTEEEVETNESNQEEEEPLEVVELPTDIDFVLTSSIGKVLYDDMDIENLKGDIELKDGKCCMRGVSFNLIGGTIGMEGCYDPTDMAHPKYDFDMSIKNASIKKAYETFNTVEKFAPMAAIMSGNFSTNFKFDGELDQEMMPIYSTMSGSGLVDILEATVTGESKGFKAIETVTGYNPLSDLKKINLKALDANIKNGRLHLKDFSVPLGSGKSMDVSGSNGVDGSLDYLMNMTLPAGAVGQNLSNSLSNATGQNIKMDKVNFDLGMLGNYDEPLVKLLGSNKDAVKDVLKDAVTNKVDNQKQDVVDKVDDSKAKAKAELEKKKAAQRKKIMDEANKRASQVRAQGKASAAKTKKEGYAAADKIIKDAGANPLKKKAAKITASKMKQETDKKAKAIQSQADKKANTIVSQAKAKADKI